MENQNADFNYLIPQLFALSAKLEGEGQYNNAKLLRSAVESFSRIAALEIALPSDNVELASEVNRAIKAISGLGISPDLTDAMKRGSNATADGRLPLINETPNPYVCRHCGYVTLEKPTVNCPQCRAQPGTFKQFMPVFWLDNYDPFQSLKRLRQTPKDLADLLEGLSESDMNLVPENGGWNIRNAVSHLRDAQGVMEFRIQLMIEQDNPRLESKAVFEWAADENDRPPETEEIFNTYNDSRHRTLLTLENLSLKDWWRTGEHEEFGTLTIMQQVSYFATHEITHFPQIEALINNFA